MDDNYAEKIIAFYQERGRMPTYTEIMQLVGFSSRGSVAKLINRLEARTLLRKDTNGALLPPRQLTATPLLGIVEAGFPAPAEAYNGETISIDDYLIPRKQASFILTVKGDSMRDAGIIEGDLVVVERGAPARVGDIVIACIDGEHTMKYYRQQGRTTFLEPANPDYPRLYPKESLSIDAVVRGVIRKYR